MQTTLNKIREHLPHVEEWNKLLRHLGKTQADDEPLSLLTILNSNGLITAIRCLCAIEGHDREIRLFAVWCGRQSQRLMKDERCITALDVAEQFANGLATDDELAAASAYSPAAARISADAAWDSAMDAAWDSAFADAMAARTSIYPNAARDPRAARDAAIATARAAQEKELRRILG